MATGDFLLVVPPGWNKFPEAEQYLYMWSVVGFQQLIEFEFWAEIEAMIETVGLLPQGMTVTAARLIDTTNSGPDRYQIWVQYAVVLPPVGPTP